MFFVHGLAGIYNPKMHKSVNDGFHESINTMPISYSSAATFKTLWGDMGWSLISKRQVKRSSYCITMDFC